MGDSVPMSAHHAEVVEVRDLSPAMRRVVFGGAGLEGYASTGVGDEYVRLLFPEHPDELPDLPPVAGDDLDWGAVDLDRLRTYTVRDWDAALRRLTIDFVVHDGGVAAAWARQARPGQVLAVNTPKGMYDPPADLAWQVLVTDCAGLPAATRIAATTPAGVRTRLVVEVADEAHRLALPELDGADHVDVTWLVGGNGHGPSGIEQVVRSLPRPDGAGYLWVAGETAVLRAVRRHLRRELGLPATAYKTVGYWTADRERWQARYDALDEDTRAALDALWDSDRDEAEIEDEYDEQLTRLGL